MNTIQLPTPSTRVKRSLVGADISPPAKRTATMPAAKRVKSKRTKTEQLSAQFLAMTKLMPAYNQCDSLRAEFGRAFMKLEYEYGNNLLCNSQSFISVVEFLDTYKERVVDEEACVQVGMEHVVYEISEFCAKIDKVMTQVIALPSNERSSVLVRSFELGPAFERMRDIITFIVMQAFRPESNIPGNIIDCLDISPTLRKKLSDLRAKRIRSTMNALYDEDKEED